MRAGVSAASTLANYRLSKTVVRPKTSFQMARYNPGKIGTPEVIGFLGLTGGGYFQAELKGLHTEVEQMAAALASIRSIGPDGKPKITSSEQDNWFNTSWIPFYVGWTNFYENYAFGWKSINFPITTSRLEQLEDWRLRFLGLRATANRIFASSTEISNLPLPTAPKTYPSEWEGLVSTIKGAVIWILAGIAAFMLITHYL
jgi:hypothetical protein